MAGNQGLTEEQIQRIIDTYNDIGNMATVAEKLGHSKDTVQKYLHQRHPKFKDDDEGEGDDFGADEFNEPDYTEMNLYDFLKWFFAIPGNDVQPSLAERVARNAQVREQLPDETRMRNILETGDSGIGNAQDAQMIAETYGRVKKKYMEANNLGEFSQPQPPVGSWVSGQPQQRQQMGPQAQIGPYQPPPQGQWDDVDDGQAVGPAGGRTRMPYPAYQMPPPPYQGQQGSSDESKEIKKLRRRLDKLGDQIESGLSDDDDKEEKSPKEAITELVELQEAIDRLRDKDDDGAAQEAIKSLEGELRNLKTDLASQADGEGGDGSGGLAPMVRMAEIASQDGMDTDTLKVVADAMGATDPEVKRAELEYKAEEARVKSRAEMIDTFFDRVGSLGGDSFDTILKIVENLTTPQQGQQPPPQQGQYQQPQPRGQPQSPTAQRVESRAERAERVAEGAMRGEPQPHQQQPQPGYERQAPQQPPPQQEQYQQPQQGPPPEQQPGHQHPQDQPGYDPGQPQAGGPQTERQDVVPKAEPSGPSRARERIEGVETEDPVDPVEPEPEAHEPIDEVAEGPVSEPTTEGNGQLDWEDWEPEEIEERYDTSSYEEFSKECMADFGGDGSICGKLWKRVTGAGGAEA